MTVDGLQRKCFQSIMLWRDRTMPEKMNLPRVLVVAYSCFDLMSGGGITMSNLFRGWPKENLAAASEMGYPLDWTICDQYYQLGSLEYRWVWPLSLLQRTWIVSGPVTFNRLQNRSQRISVATGSHHATSHKAPMPQSRAKRFFFNTIKSLGSDELLLRTNLSDNLLAWARFFQPDVIYTQLGSLSKICLVKRIAEATGASLAIHIMDDWPATRYRQGWLSSYLRLRMDAEFRQLLDSASTVMAISPQMARVYEQRYGRTFAVFHNPIQLEQWQPYAKSHWDGGNPFKIVYTGRIGQANQNSLQDLSRAVANLYARGHAIRMNIYSVDHDSDVGHSLQQPGCVYIKPPVAHTDIPETLSGADLLVLPLDFDVDSIRYAQYSMPTKASEYMASGTPVLVYAPLAAAVAEYAQEEKWGRVVSEQNLSRLQDAISCLIQDVSAREQLGRRAQRIAAEKHDATRVRAEFLRTLAACCAL